MSYDNEQLRRIIEGAIMAAGEALSVDKLHGLFEEHEAPEKSEIKAVLEAIAADCEGRGYHLVEVASGWRFQVREEIATWVNRLWEEKPQKYSRALLETLALIAYRQPITRGDIEEVRGVAVSSHIIKTLSEREWIKVVGHRDVPGRPSLYATTRHFLDYFNLKSLDELPTLSELKDIDNINGSLDLGNDADDCEDADSEAASSIESAETAEPGEAAETEEPEEADATESAEPQEKDTLAEEAAQIFDPDEGRELDAMVSDSVVTGDDDQVPVEEADFPFELDEEVSQPKNDDLAEAEPTVEQEEFSEAQHEDDSHAEDDNEREDEQPSDSDQR